MNIGTKQAREVCALLGVDWKDGSLGIEWDFIKPRFTRDQQCGHWLLLNTWLQMSDLTVSAEKLHQWCLGKTYGYFESELPDGRMDWIPVRTTTKVWDQEKMKYVRKKMNRETYSHYIESIYRLAIEGGVDLPQLERSREK